MCQLKLSIFFIIILCVSILVIKILLKTISRTRSIYINLSLVGKLIHTCINVILKIIFAAILIIYSPELSNWIDLNVLKCFWVSNICLQMMEMLFEETVIASVICIHRLDCDIYFFFAYKCIFIFIKISVKILEITSFFCKQRIFESVLVYLYTCIFAVIASRYHIPYLYQGRCLIKLLGVTSIKLWYIILIYLILIYL